MDRMDEILRHIERAAWHVNQAKALGYEVATQPEVERVYTGESEEPVASVITNVDKVILSSFSGWVSDMYRCGDDDTPEQQINGNVGARSHPAHRYGRNSGQWCDGYI